MEFKRANHATFLHAHKINLMLPKFTGSREFDSGDHERRARLPKPRNAEEKRLDKMRAQYKRLGIKINF